MAASLSIITCVCLAQTRQPAVAGKFYPDNKQELASMIRGFIDAVPETSVIDEQKNGEIIGVISPHAGYVFSGGVAAYSYKQLKNKSYDIVVIMGQSHNYALQKAALCADYSFATPLGDVKVEKKIVQALLEISGKQSRAAGQALSAGPGRQPDALFEMNQRAHIPEHSIEVQLPFLQNVLAGEFKIVPILVGNFSMDACRSTAKKIVSVLKKEAPGKRILFVISSDMSHYPAYTDAGKSDRRAIEAFEKLDPEYLNKTIGMLMASGIPSLACVFCGEEAVYTGMYAMKAFGADKVISLKYANSGDVPEYGVKDRVVGYYAAALVKSGAKTGDKTGGGAGFSQSRNSGTSGAIGVAPELKKNDKSGSKMTKEFTVAQKNQKILLELARSTLADYFKTGKIKDFSTTDAELTAPAAVFVTLTISGQLRGCIGTTAPQAPLYRAVQQMALAAAFEDYRFKQLTPEELDKIKIEISVLSPLTKVKSAAEVKEKIHGVTVRRGGRSGLFLPQVWEHFENKEDFLGELCSQKAGLPSNAWCDPGTELCVFTVFAFEEK